MQRNLLSARLVRPVSAATAPSAASVRVLPVGFASAASLAAIQRGLGADGEPASVIDRCAHIGATPACGFAVAHTEGAGVPF